MMSFEPHRYLAAAAKSLQSCPTLCDPLDGSPPGSPVPGILQATTLEWVPYIGTIIIPILHMGKLRVGKLQQLTQGHTNKC